MRGHREKTAIYKPRREVSRETSPAGVLILDIQPPDCEKMNAYCLKLMSVVLCYGGLRKLIQRVFRVSALILDTFFE